MPSACAVEDVGAVVWTDQTYGIDDFGNVIWTNQMYGLDDTAPAAPGITLPIGAAMVGGFFLVVAGIWGGFIHRSGGDGAAVGGMSRRRRRSRNRR